jgi:hypothetical protein
LPVARSGRGADRRRTAGAAHPERTVSIVVPYSPGGGHDAMARIVAERLSKRLGQAVIVENKAGANGMVGTEFVTRAAPDGYTILFASPAEIVIAPSAYKAMRYDAVKDLAPVTLAATTPLVLVANPSLGVHTLAELIALAKRKPGTLSFGTSGNATSQHLAGVWLNSLAGIDERRSRTKPRTSGLSTVIDDGLPLAYAQSVVETAAPYIDLMKIKTGTARLYARPQLEAKLARYRAAQVRPFVGGQFHEYVFAMLGEAALPRFYEEPLALGFDTIEISDNPWIAGVRQCDVEAMKKVAFAEFGPNVNLASIDVRTIFDTEAQRVGLGTAGPLA